MLRNTLKRRLRVHIKTAWTFSNKVFDAKRLVSFISRRCTGKTIYGAVYLWTCVVTIPSSSPPVLLLLQSTYTQPDTLTHTHTVAERVAMNEMKREWNANMIMPTKDVIRKECRLRLSLKAFAVLFLCGELMVHNWIRAFALRAANHWQVDAIQTSIGMQRIRLRAHMHINDFHRL